MSTIYTTFPTILKAEVAISALKQAGVRAESISLLANQKQPVGANVTELPGNQGMSPQVAQQYASFLQTGGAVLALTDVQLPTARQILSQNGGTILEQGRDATSAAIDSGASVIPVVQEELQVGKHEVQRGGVRVESLVSERAVEEDITLREEQVNVTRRPVDRTATAADFDPLPGGAIEVRAVNEEAVVAKQARVVEEVLINKQVSERTEHISDTVRRTDVEIQQLSNQFRQDFDTRFRGKTLKFEEAEPAYNYGYQLRSEPRFANKTWDAVRSDVETSWTKNNQGRRWQDYSEAVRYGYDQK